MIKGWGFGDIAIHLKRSFTEHIEKENWEKPSSRGWLGKRILKSAACHLMIFYLFDITFLSDSGAGFYQRLLTADVCIMPCIYKWWQFVLKIRKTGNVREFNSCPRNVQEVSVEKCQYLDNQMARRSKHIHVRTYQRRPSQSSSPVMTLASKNCD